MGRQHRKHKGKAREVDDSGEYDDVLSQSLPKAGLEVRPMKADGNCLFRAFASQYCGDERKHFQFRTDCCDYMLNEDPEFFRSFLDERSLENYVSEMQHDGSWGSQMEIVALSRRFRANLVIFRPDGLHYRIECDSGDESISRILMLSHHEDEHFNEVCFSEPGRVLNSYEELELLLTELDESPKRLSKKDLRRSKGKNSAPEVVRNKIDQRLVDL